MYQYVYGESTHGSMRAIRTRRPTTSIIELESNCIVRQTHPIYNVSRRNIHSSLQLYTGKKRNRMNYRNGVLSREKTNILEAKRCLGISEKVARRCCSDVPGHLGIGVTAKEFRVCNTGPWHTATMGPI